MHDAAGLVKTAYDQIASGYDERWSVHIRAPQMRLTAALGLSAHMRCADLGCGTGLDTVEMAQLTAPEPVHAVDCSKKMLEEACARAEAGSCAVVPVCSDVESFVARAADASFDVLSLRFCLAYLPWRRIVPELARLLRPRGKLGILTNLATSAPQALAVYRGMVEEFGLPNIQPSVPESVEDMNRALAKAGLRCEQQWSDAFQLWFESGAHVSAWLAESGFVTHPALSAAPPELQRALWAAFAARIEEYRGPRGIPLDFAFAGTVAVRATDH